VKTHLKKKINSIFVFGLFVNAFVWRRENQILTNGAFNPFAYSTSKIPIYLALLWSC
jgi:hypothetical protein